MDYREKIEVLMSEASTLPHSAYKVQLLEETVQIADQHNETELAFEARNDLVTAAVFNKESQKAIVSFSWCLSLCDSRPDEFSDIELLSKYKWIINHLSGFPDVSAAQLDKLIEDAIDRHEKHNTSPRSVYTIAAYVYKARGEKKQALSMFQKMLSTPTGAHSNCEACDLDDQVAFLVYQGEFEAALKKAEPLLRNEISCKTVPLLTKCVLLEPLIYLGELDKANSFYQQIKKKIVNNPRRSNCHVYLITYLTHTEQFIEANQIISRYASGIVQRLDKECQFDYWIAVYMLWLKINQNGEEDLSNMSLPKHFIVKSNNLTDLLNGLEYELLAIADLFDKSHNTDYHHKLLAKAKTGILSCTD